MHKVDKKTFGKYIKSKREEAGMEQKTLADKLSVSRDAISKWENGKRYPDLEMLSMLADALGISVQDIVDNSKIEVKDHRYLGNISVIVLVVVLMGGAFFGFIKNRNNYYQVNGIYKNEYGIYEVDTRELNKECIELQGKKIGKIQLPSSLSISENAEPCSFDADIIAPKEIELDDLIRIVYGENYKLSDFKPGGSEEIYYDSDDVLMRIGSADSGINYIRQLEPIKWQTAYYGIEIEDVIKIEKVHQDNTLKRYNMILEKIRDLYYSKDYHYKLQGIGEEVSLSCDNSVIDYFDIDIVYNDIPINNITKSDKASHVYKFYISFLDEDKIGSLQIDKYFSCPDNIEYYEKIMSLYNATEILNSHLNKNTKVTKVDLVYARNRDVGESYKTNDNRFYPFWRFEIKSDNQIYFVNVITGELY